jgi:AraC-like DNA-binding protein
MQVRNIHGGMATYPPGAALAERVMNDFEFVWIIRGNVLWHANGRQYPTPPGTIILSRPGFIEGYRWDPHAPTRHAYFHFDLAGATTKQLPPKSKWPLLKPMPDGDILRPLFAYIVASVSPDNLRGGTLKPAVIKAIETMLAAFVTGPVGSERADTGDVPEPVHRAIQFVAETLARTPAASITLIDMAAAANVTSKHLCRLFREHVELTPMHAVLALRLRHALQLMARTDFKLERIAHECGFATAFHFSRRFRDVYGKPPSAIRADLAAGRFQPPIRLLWGDRLTVEYPT